MQSVRSTVALLLVLVGLGAYIYFVTWRQEDPSLSTKDRVYTPLTADDIVEFTVHDETGASTTVKKVGEETWEITSPITYPAEITQVNGLTSILSYLDRVRIIDEDPQDLEQYGLAKPRLSVDFKVKDGHTFGSLLIGNKNPTGANLYAKRADEKPVFLIGQHQEASLNRTTFDFRSKKIVDFTTAQVTGLEVTDGRQKLAFKKDLERNRWSMVSPVAARADAGEVDKVINSIEIAQMRSVFADNATPEDLRKTGLDKPALTATVDAGANQTKLLIGSAADEDEFYAKDATKPLVMTVEKILVDDLKKSVDTFRKKEIFEFTTPTASKVEVTRNGETVVLEKGKGEGAAAVENWQRTSGTPTDVDKTTMESLLTQLVDLRATAFTASSSTRNPELTILVASSEAPREERVTFYRTGSDVYASRSDEPGGLKIDASAFDKAVATLDELSK